jgi:hypothetical protein
VRWPRRRAAGAVALAAVLAGCGSSPAAPERAPAPAAEPRSLPSTEKARGRDPLVRCGNRADDRTERRPGRLFAPDSVWNAPLAEDAPQGDPRLVASLLREVRREIAAGIGPYIQTTTFSTPLYVVGDAQRCSRVTLDATSPLAASLRRAFARVPIPEGAEPAEGTDRHLTVYQPGTDSLWEFWKLRKEPDGWRAGWGGAIRGVSGNSGSYDRSAWPGAERYWGASATSLPVIAGTMRVEELRTGRIEHALAMSIPDPKRDAYSPPAQRTDGEDPAADAIPAGTRFRLDPAVDVRSLLLPPVVEAMALAAQRHGMIVRDRTHKAVGFYAEDPKGAGIPNPYGDLFDGQVSSVLLADFPWDRLQVVRAPVRRGNGRALDPD